MAVVIDEMESTVEAEGTRAPGTENTGSQQGGGPKTIARDQLAAELRRIAVRRERLRAD
jgi:hypothetical protein